MGLSSLDERRGSRLLREADEYHETQATLARIEAELADLKRIDAELADLKQLLRNA